jgi:hypothetical protein
MVGNISSLLIRYLVGNLSRTAGTVCIRFSGEIESPVLSPNEWLGEIDGIVDDDDVEQMPIVSDEMLRHCGLIARGNTVSHDPAHLDVGGCHN